MFTNTFAGTNLRRKPYKILTEDDIHHLIDGDISKVSGALAVSRGTACHLLCRNNWNLTAATADKNPQFSAAADSSQLKLGQHACNICYDELNPQNTFSAACGHPFCAYCWQTYVATAIGDGAGCLTLTCPEPGCSAAAGVDLVQSTASTADIRKYHRYLRRSYVECSRRTKWCPAAGCDLAVDFDGGAADYDVTCRCSRKFCWNCAARHHRPVRCEAAAGAEAEAASKRWIAANTKPCPKCRRHIEKNKGCDTMTCLCLCRFCWLCGKPTDIHADCCWNILEREDDYVANRPWAATARPPHRISNRFRVYFFIISYLFLLFITTVFGIYWCKKHSRSTTKQ